MVTRLRKNTPPPPPAATEIEEDIDLPGPGGDGEEAGEKIDFFEYLAQLDDKLRNKATVYVYRLSPRVKKVGATHAIDKYAARLFAEDTLKEDHGGGRYKLYLDTGVKASNLTRVVEIFGTPAKIYPDQILVDDQGNPQPMQQTQPSAGTDGPVNRSELLDVLTTVLDRVQKKDVSTTDAVSELASLYKQAAATAVEIGTAGAKHQINNPQGGDATAALLREVLAEMRKGDPLTKKVMDMAVEKMLNPPPPAATPDLFATLKQLQELTGAEGGGGLGILKTIMGGGSGESFWEGVGKEMFSSLSVAVRENAPALLQWLREREHFKYVQAMTARQAAGGSAPSGAPTPVPSVVVPRPVPVPSATNPGLAQGAPQTQPSAQPRATAPSNEDEMIQAMVFEITSLIKRCWDRSKAAGEEADGISTANVVKLAYPGVLTFIRSSFNDLEKLKQMAATDAVLSAIAGDPAFPEFAADFFEELHTIDATEAPIASA